MIKVIGISKSFGAQNLFEDVSINFNKGERVGLVGRNGHGKTTLLRMITGEEAPDSGEISRPRDYSPGYLRQHIDMSCPTVLEEGVKGLSEHSKDEKWIVEKTLSGLGFSSDDMRRPPTELSGGYQLRLSLAKVLVSDPDALLLDEPTNYLDIVSIRWLASFLRQWKKELLLITHDRMFMDSVVTHIAGIHRKKIKKIRGNTGDYYEQTLKEEEIHEKTRLNDEKKRKETEIFIRRFRAKARLAGLVQSRIKALEKTENLNKLEKIKTLEFGFASKPFQAKSLMNVKELTFGYDPAKPLIKDLSFTINKNDRICVIGKNGRGKSTLLRLLCGDLTPQSGETLVHASASFGYYGQTNRISLNPSSTVEAEIMSAGCEKQQARDICGAMMFEGDDALKTINVLSGGEKARVLLGKILASPSNLLILDEPTNHLDMESCDSFLSAIDAFDGAVVMVTHNEMFLHSLANRFIVFQNNGAVLFEGSYRRFLDKAGWEEETGADTVRPAINEQLNKKDARKKRADIISRRVKELKPLEEGIAALEKRIEESEKKQKLLNDGIIAASSAGESQKIGALSIELHNARAETDSLYEELLLLTESFEQRSAEFEAELDSVSN